MNSRALTVRWLGRMAFADALALQEKLVAERRADHSRAERYRRSLGVQASRKFHVGSRTIRVMLQVVLARPGELDRRRRHRFGDLNSLGDVIRAAAPSESATQILGVDQALGGRQPGDA